MKNRQKERYIKQKSQAAFGRILVVTGARQTGKTTLLKQLFPDYAYISIEDPVSSEEYKKLTAQQWAELFPRAILDEVQKEPRFVESIKAVYDQYDEPRYILSGSSQIMLLQKIRESLAGRSHIIELFPLTLPEMLTNGWDDPAENSYFQKMLLKEELPKLPFLLDPTHPKKKKCFDTYLRFGGYPALSDSSLNEEDKYDWLNNYVRTYLERDIRDLAELRRLEPFTKVQKLFALNTAQLTNHTRIANEAGVSSKTAQSFLEYMNISYQTITLQAWQRNSSKRLVKSPKVHFMDIGVLRAILRKKGELTGNEFESAIVAEIYKQAMQLNTGISFYHLRTHDGREVDLLLELEEGYIAIEIKKSEKVRYVDAKHLKNLEDILDKPVLKKIVLSNDLSIKDLGNEVVGMPAVQFLT